MTYIKLLTVLAGLALLTACGGSTPETKTDNTGEPAVSCDTNPYGADCGTEFETQRLSIVSECTDDNTGDLCTDATTFACTDNFFHELCTANEYEQLRVEFNKTCTNTKSKEVCDMEALVRTCAANPFMNTCLMDMGAIALRESRCLANIQIDDSCRGAQGIATLFCEANPFDTATPCMHGDYADERQSMCLANIMIDDSCRGDRGIATLFCEADPFNTATACVADAYADERLAMCVGDITTPRCMRIVTPVCEANNGFNNPVCRGIEKYDEQLRCASIPTCADGVVNNADWLGSFNGGSPPTSLDTSITNKDDRKRQFLAGGPAGLDTTTGSPNITGGTNISLTIESAMYNDAPLGRTEHAGVGFAIFFDDGEVNTDLKGVYYAGLLSGTNLGAPLTETAGNATWNGQIITIRRGVSSLGIDQDFTLNITFGEKTAGDGSAGSIEGITQTGGSTRYQLTGTYDAGGVISGKVIYGSFTGSPPVTTEAPNGILTGLIGELGAVGTFIAGTGTKENIIGETDEEISYAGGFVVISTKEAARLAKIEQDRLDELERQRLERERIERELREMTIEYTDWTGSFDPAPPATPSTTPTNQFLANPATAPTTLTNTMGGVGFFTANGASYAGLLSNTNLGLPVPMMPQVDNADVTAVWPGMIQATGVFLPENFNFSEILTPISFNLNVNFTTRKLTGQAVNPQHTSRRIDIFGDFLESDNGVITGTVETRVQTSPLFLRIGNLTGLIGQDGAVGAFVYTSGTNGTNNPQPFAGGFYAAPQ